MDVTKAQVFAFTYKEEGGYGNDPNDPGGATNLGITQAEYDAYRHMKVLDFQSVRYITKSEADEIYTKYYWNKIHGDELPSGIDLVLYDYAVNSGVARATKYAQILLKVGVDGKLGPITLAALKTTEAKAFIIAFDRARLSFLHRLRIWRFFGSGWNKRVNRATKAALGMIGEPMTETKAMLPVLLMSLGRHIFGGAGLSFAAFNGFDIHNPLTWLGGVQFVAALGMSWADKLQHEKQLDFMTIVADGLTVINEKLDTASGVDHKV